MHNKRGISTIIATLLLIALTIVLATIVWFVIRNLVSSTSTGININGLTLDLKIQSAQIILNNISVVVQRQPGAGTLAGINFIVSDGTNYESIRQNASLDVYQGGTFIVVPKQIVANATKTISVAPIYTSSGTQQVGGITDTYTFGVFNSSGSSGGSNGGTGGNGGGNNGGGSTCTPDLNPTFASLCTNNGYACGDVNNGTCSTVSCGTCSSGQICNLSSYQCVTSGGSTCTPDLNPTFASLCTNNGYACGDVNNGTCSTVSCGTCSSGQICNLSSYQCVTSGGTTCTPSTCSTFNQCGNPPDGCGGTLTCPVCTGADSFCNSYFQCDTYEMVNNGTIFSVWPSGAVQFFDSSDLPTDPNVITLYDDGQHYIRFPGSNETRCIQILLATPEASPNTISYVSLGLSADIASGNNYQVWNSQQGCILHPGY